MFQNSPLQIQQLVSSPKYRKLCDSLHWNQVAVMKIQILLRHSVSRPLKRFRHPPTSNFFLVFLWIPETLTNFNAQIAQILTISHKLYFQCFWNLFRTIQNFSFVFFGLFFDFLFSNFNLNKHIFYTIYMEITFFTISDWKIFK